MTFEEIFSPGLRHWREYKDFQATRITQAPAAGRGPVRVDLDQEIVTIEVDAPAVDDDPTPGPAYT